MTKPIKTIAAKLGIPSKYLELYGDYKAKVSLDLLNKAKIRKRSKYIVVTGITPTHFGEGKTVTTIGLSMALGRPASRACACIRQPSLGPFFGVKGSGSGGGLARVVTNKGGEADFYLTGDIHAVGQAHNLAAAFLDNHLLRKNRLNIDIDRIFWHRVLDTNDRSLRNVVIGIGGEEFGVERKTRFDITAASEIMAILALAGSYADLRKRLGRTVVALARNGQAVTCDDIKAAGAMAALLSDALKPNLVQTPEGTPCFVHAGPFANITHGNSSIIADRMALGLADFVVTESGFGADCGLEKFVDIKCRTSGLIPDAVVLVLSIRALKVHSGIFKASPGKDLDKDIYKENVEAVEMGIANLEKQLENVRMFGVPCVVAINKFATDSDGEISLVKSVARQNGAFDCVVSDIYRRGSEGGMDLARAVKAATKTKAKFRFLYPSNLSIKAKIEAIAKRIYGAAGVRYDAKADEDISLFEKLGYGRLPVCMAKTHLSLSHDPKVKGRPKGFTLPVVDVRPSIGAGFLYALCGKVMTMPSLPSHPIGERIDIDSKGRIVVSGKG